MHCQIYFMQNTDNESLGSKGCVKVKFQCNIQTSFRLKLEDVQNFMFLSASPELFSDSAQFKVIE